MASLRDIFVRLGVKTDPKEMKQAESGLASIKKLALGAVAAFGGFRLGAFAADLVTETAAIGDSIDKVSSKLGVATGALQELRFAADQSGVAQNALDMGLQRFTRRASEAAQGTGVALKAFEEMGITLNDANGNMLPAQDLLGQVADALKNTSSDADRVRLAFKLFDSEGVNMVNMLKGGRQNLEALRKKARETGGVMDADLIQASVEYTDQLSELRLTMRGMKNVLAGTLLPIVTRAMKRFMEFAKANRSVVEAFAQWARGASAKFIERLAVAYDRTKRVLGAVVDLTVEAATAARNWAEGLGPVGRQILKITGVVLAFLAVLMLPGAAILILIALIGLLIEDFQTWRKGGESVIGDLIWAFQELGAIISDWASQTLADIANAWNGILEAVSSAVDGMIAAVFSFGDAILETIADINLWLDEYRTTISVVTSMAMAAAGLWAAHWIRANALAIEWFVRWHARSIAMMVKTRVFAIKSAFLTSIAWVKSAARATAAWAVTSAWMARLWIHQAMQATAAAARSAAVWVASAARTAAAWLVSTVPLVLTAALLTVIIGTLIFLGRELVRLALGQENFFSAMSDGFTDLEEQYGGIGPAIGAMLDEAIRFWADFFGATEDEIDGFIEAATDTLNDFWDNVIDSWKETASSFFGWVGDKIPTFGLFGDDDEGESPAQRGEAAVRGAIDRTASAQATGPAAPLASMPGPLASGAVSRGPMVGGTTSVVQNRTDNISVNVQATPGMDERRLAEMIPMEIRRAREEELRQESQSFVLEGAT